MSRITEYADWTGIVFQLTPEEVEFLRQIAGGGGGGPPQVRYDAQGRAWEWNGTEWVRAPQWDGARTAPSTTVVQNEPVSSGAVFTEEEVRARARQIGATVSDIGGVLRVIMPDGTYIDYQPLRTRDGTIRYDPQAPRSPSEESGRTIPLSSRAAPMSQQRWDTDRLGASGGGALTQSNVNRNNLIDFIILNSGSSPGALRGGMTSTGAPYPREQLASDLARHNQSNNQAIIRAFGGTPTGDPVQDAAAAAFFQSERDRLLAEGRNPLEVQQQLSRGVDLGGGFVPGMGPPRDNDVQTIRETFPGSGIYEARSRNVDLRTMPHDYEFMARGGRLVLDEPTIGISLPALMRGQIDPQFVAAEAGMAEIVEPVRGGLRFVPTRRRIGRFQEGGELQFDPDYWANLLNGLQGNAVSPLDVAPSTNGGAYIGDGADVGPPGPSALDTNPPARKLSRDYTDVRNLPITTQPIEATPVPPSGANEPVQPRPLPIASIVQPIDATPTLPLPPAPAPTGGAPASTAPPGIGPEGGFLPEDLDAIQRAVQARRMAYQAARYDLAGLPPPQAIGLQMPPGFYWDYNNFLGGTRNLFDLWRQGMGNAAAQPPVTGVDSRSTGANSGPVIGSPFPDTGGDYIGDGADVGPPGPSALDTLWWRNPPARKPVVAFAGGGRVAYDDPLKEAKMAGMSLNQILASRLMPPPLGKGLVAR